MRSFIGKTIAGVVLASTVALTAAPADAQRYRRHHRGGDDAAWAVGAGIVGLGIGAAIASSSRRDRYGDRYYSDYGGGYYNQGYYGRGYASGGYYADPYYGGYNRGYNRGYGRGYARNCVTRRVWDGYYGRWTRVRYC